MRLREHDGMSYGVWGGLFPGEIAAWIALPGVGKSLDLQAGDALRLP